MEDLRILDVSKRKLIVCIIIVNIIAIIFSGWKIIHETQDNVIFENAYTGNKWLKLDASDVIRGVYQVTVSYETNRSECTVNMETGEKRYQLLQSEQYALSPDKDQISFTFWLNHRADMLSVIVDCGDVEKEDTYLTIHEISISRRQYGSTAYELLKVLLAFGILDLIVIIALNYEWVKKNYYILLGLVAVTAISSLGIMTNPLPGGHDLPFHLSRIWGLKEGISAGEFPVKIQPGWCNGYGYPTSIFYGDIFLYFPAVLTLLRVPLYTAYKAYVFVINLGTVLTAYFCFKKISGDEKVGVVCSAVYTLSIYRLCNVYLRAAVGEYTAMLFIPLIILGMWEILAENTKRKDYQIQWVWLCLGVSGLIQSHVLSCEMVGIFLVLVCIIFIKRVFRKSTLIVIAKSIIATLLLNAGFLIPFLDYAGEELNVFAEKDFYGIQKYGMSIYELFALNSTGAGSVIYADNNLGIRMPVSLGFVSLIAFLLSITILIKSQELSGRKKQLLAMVSFLAGVAVWFASDLFPWDSLQGIKGLKQITGTLEFPFRYLSIAMAIITLMLCLSLQIIVKSGKWKDCTSILLLGLLFVCVWQSVGYLDHVIRESGSIIVYDGTTMNAETSSLYGGEYVYVGTDYEKAAKTATVVSNAEITDIERNGNQFVISCIADEETYMKIPLFYYPDYKCVDVENRTELTVLKGDNNELWVQIPEGYCGTFRIAFVEPVAWRTAEILSLLMLLFLVGYGVVYKFNANTPGKDNS